MKHASSITAQAISFARTAIPRLLAPCCPPTIVWLVITIIVNAIQCSAIGANAHIGEECVERSSPARAHLDSTSAIILVGGMFSQIASAQHGVPGIPCCRVFAAFSMSMHGLSCSKKFPLQATTAFAYTANKLPTFNRPNSSATTPTLPQCPTADCRSGPLNNYPSSKCFAVEVGWVSHTHQCNAINDSWSSEIKTPPTY